MLKKMSDEQKNEVLKEKKQKEAERKALYRMKKKLHLHQKMHINLVPAREKSLQGSREVSLVVSTICHYFRCLCTFYQILSATTLSFNDLRILDF